MTTRSKPAGRLALLAFAVASLALGTAGPAFGRAPERAHVQQSFEGVIDCGVFQDSYVDEETGDLTWYFDADGRLVRFVVHVSQYSTDVNSVTARSPSTAITSRASVPTMSSPLLPPTIVACSPKQLCWSAFAGPLFCGRGENRDQHRDG